MVTGKTSEEKHCSHAPCGPCGTRLRSPLRRTAHRARGYNAPRRKGLAAAALRAARAQLHRYGLALDLANQVKIAGAFMTGRQVQSGSVLAHLVIYQSADGPLALSFAHLDEPGGEQMDYFGCAKLSVLKSGGQWTGIKGPESLHGKGWAVRYHLQSNYEAIKTLERIQTK